ncbi:MAG: TetR family transcriptional regulator [Actinomycetales bacterium]|nr:TetR family transcriptional regulator [Actinomycetales bacterium]
MTDARTASPGLRERKRRATRRAILLATLDLIERKGLDAVTIDDIARAADVSPRTFFNYFASKEEAFVGDGPSATDPEAVARFLADRGPLWEALRDFLIASARPALVDQEIVVRRRALIKRHPELNARRIAALHHFEFDLVDLIARRLSGGPAADADAATRRRARYFAFLAVAAMRQAWMNWAELPGARTSLDEQLRDAFDELPRVAAEGARA